MPSEFARMKHARRAALQKKHEALALLLGWEFDQRTRRWYLANTHGLIIRFADSARQAVYKSTHDKPKRFNHVGKQHGT